MFCLPNLDNFVYPDVYYPSESVQGSVDLDYRNILRFWTFGRKISQQFRRRNRGNSYHTRNFIHHRNGFDWRILEILHALKICSAMGLGRKSSVLRNEPNAPTRTCRRLLLTRASRLNTRRNSRRNPQGLNSFSIPLLNRFLNRELDVGRADEVIMNDSEDEEKDTESHGYYKHDNTDNNQPTPPKHKRW